MKKWQILLSFSLCFSLFLFQFLSNEKIEEEGKESLKKISSLSRKEKLKIRAKNRVADRAKMLAKTNQTKNENKAPRRVPSSGNKKTRIVERHPNAKEQSRHYEGALTSFFSEEVVKIGNQKLKISENLVAKPLSVLGAERVLYRLGSFGIVEEQIEDPLSHHQVFRVVYDQSKKRYLILTGQVFVRFKNDVDEQTLSSEYRLTFVDKISHLKFTIARPNEGVSLLNIQQALSEHPNVESFEIEILEDGIHEK